MYNSIVLRKRSSKPKGELVMKKKWFVVMVLLISLLAAGCGRKDKIERNAQFISAGYGHTVALKADGIAKAHHEVGLLLSRSGKTVHLCFLP